VALTATNGTLALAATGANGITASTNGAVRWTLDPAGNLGLGTTNPSGASGTTFAINGGAGQTRIALKNTASGDTSTDGFQIALLADGANVVFQNRETGYQSWEIAGTERMRLDSAGNLGLGAVPSAWGSNYRALQVTGFGTALFGLNGGGGQTYLSHNVYNDNTSFRYITSFAASAMTTDGSGGWRWLLAPSGTAGSPITFTQAMTLDASGNLGIGTNSPFDLLHVNGGNIRSAGATGAQFTGLININYGASASVYKGLFYDAQNENGVAVANMLCDVNTDGSSSWSWSTTPAGARTSDRRVERMRVDKDGNLMLGVTAIGAPIRLTVRSAGTTSAGYNTYLENSAATLLGYVLNDGRWSTGVAAASPYNLTTASAANVVVDAGGVLYRSTSSIKYKTDVADATHGLKEVLQLRSVTYKGVNDAGRVFGGLIAEEVHAAGLSEFVQYAADGSPDALAYANMVSLCIKAIQEQQAIIESLTQRITALEAK
jgi:hypothetical protein